MTGAKNPLATALGTYYPTHFIVAAFDDLASATQALAALRAAFADAAVDICPGPRFLENYRDFVAHRSLLARAVELVPAEEKDVAAEYVAEAERGASFVSVHAPQCAERERARGILAAHGGHGMRYYGVFTITDLA